MPNLVLHAGAQFATLEQVQNVVTPDATDTHFPIPHAQLVDQVVGTIGEAGWQVEEQEYGLWGDEGERMFALFMLRNGMSHDDYQLTVGIRNSHDKRFSAGLAVGSRVFVCDNLAFSADIVFARKHTRNIVRDLDRLVAQAVGQINGAREQQDRRIEAYKDTRMTDMQVHDFLVRGMLAKVAANSYIPKVLEEWQRPSHEDFAPRTAWSLFNAYTEVLKRTNPLDLPARTTRLHGLMDLQAGIVGQLAPGAPELN